MVGKGMKPYFIPDAQWCTCEDVIQKSRFITIINHTPNVEAAKSFIQEVKQLYPDARHHCWAFVAGAPTNSQVLGFSDDGEPSGTAGKPILAQLQGSGIGEITAVVVRYFGGTLLGTGGLVRAYGQGVQKALKLLTLQEKVPMQSFSLAVDYAQHPDVEHAINLFQGVVEHHLFTDCVTLQFALPFDKVDSFNQHLIDLSRGKLCLKKEE